MAHPTQANSFLMVVADPVIAKIEWVRVFDQLTMLRA